MSNINQKEYLKKYLSLGKAPGEKKKKKIKSNNIKRVKIIDDDLSVNISKEIEEDLSGAVEDAPQVVAVIDERPPSLGLDVWKPIGSAAQNDETRLQNKDVTLLKRKQLKSFQTKSKDLSPPRSIKKSANNDLSPPRNRVEDDISPPRHKKKNLQDDFSPPRRRKKEIDDFSPPRKRVENDNSLPRCMKKETDDLSPPRKHSRSQKSSEDDLSPPRKNIKIDKDQDISPPRHRKDEDSSPPRCRKDKDLSPPRKSNKKDLSPKHTKDKKPQRSKSRWDNEENELTETKKSVTTLEGKKAGLQNAKDLIMETKTFKENEDALYKNLLPEVSGRHAETVFRGKKSKNEEKDLEKLKKEKENEAKYNKWGKGLKQIEDRNEKLAEQLHEMSKPLARYADDEDLEQYLKDQEREGDPMLAYLRKKKRKDAIDAGVALKPQYEGEFMPNRFGIRPGHRWDGVNRSNGYEEKWFKVQNSRKAEIEESYKWSTEDM